MQPINAVLLALALCITFVSVVDARRVANHSRVSHGSPAGPGRFKSFVLVEMDDGNMCGGVLIDPRIVLTARHCTEPSSQTYTVIPTHYGKDKAYLHKDRARDVKTVCKWKGDNPDIALLLLKEPVDMSNSEIGISPMATKEAEMDEHLIQVGSGRINRREFAKELQYIDVYRDRICDHAIGPMPSAFCYSGYEPEEEACPGDSGSPLYRMIGDENYEIVGIVRAGCNSVCGLVICDEQALYGGQGSATHIPLYRKDIWGLMQDCLNSHN